VAWLCLFFERADFYHQAMMSEPPGITGLKPGQALHMAVDAGLALRVLAGSVRVVSPPAWIGETVFRGTATIHAEQVHVFERAGWAEIVPLSAARVQALPRSALSMSMPMIGRWLRRFAGLM
jgi:hypothetical protein